MELKLKKEEKILAEILQYGLTKFLGYFLGFVFLGLAAFFMFWFFDHDWWGITSVSILIFL